VLLAIWEAAYRTVGWDPVLFPAPSQLVDSTLDMLNLRTGFGEPVTRGWPRSHYQTVHKRGNMFTSPLVQANLISGGRLIFGFACSLLLGSVLGGVMWRIKSVDEFFGPVALGLQTLPSVCWVPMASLLFGYEWRAIQFVLILGSMFAIAISVRDGMKTIPPLYQRAGLMLGATGWRGYAYVLLPASLPALSSGLRQGFSFAWRSLMGAELVFGAAMTPWGLGVLLANGRRDVDPSQMVAVMIMIVVIGMAADRLVFGPIERRVYRRFGLNQSH
jgi:NitT/TauT family transport system permease protein